MYPDTKGLEDAQAQYMQMLWQVTTSPVLERNRFLVCASAVVGDTTNS